MLNRNERESLGIDLPVGSHHYRAFVGSSWLYDLVAATQFNLLTALGLREYHYLLDIGCGSLRAGRLFIPYLLSGRYFGIEPEPWLIESGIANEVGEDLIRIKKPTFSHDKNFTLTMFNQKFDFVLAQEIFVHASQAQISKCLSEAKKVMNPVAVLAATFREGQDNYRGSEWHYPNCVEYTLNRMKELAEEQHLICKPVDWAHPGPQSWLLYTHPENEGNILGVDAGSGRLRLLGRMRYTENLIS
jgi:methyltransferase family protein